MFRYLARRHDHKHILKSLRRQERITDRSIEFSHDTALAFAVNEAEDKNAVGCELAFTDISEGERFYSPIYPSEPLNIGEKRVTFQSDITTSNQENNTFDCLISDSGSKDHAIIVFHHWYARNRYPAFSKFFASKGITVVEVTLPYHFERGVDDYSEENFLNANLGRTVRSVRQAVLDGRKVVGWLRSHGYRKISVVGMCIGGTVAGLIAAQDDRVDKAVLMVTPVSPADLVWTAETMGGIRHRIEPNMSLESLRTAWGLISLEKHTWSLTRSGLDLMFVLGNDDTIVRPGTADNLIGTLQACDRPPHVTRLNCGHSSIGIFPFNTIAANKVLRFLKETPTLRELWEMRGFRYDFSEV